MSVVDTVWQFFFRRESNRHHPKDRPAVCVQLNLPADTSLADALAAAYAAGMPRGSHRAGCFEVQCPTGIYQHVEGNRLDGAPATKVQFKTWDELDAESDC